MEQKLYERMIDLDEKVEKKKELIEIIKKEFGCDITAEYEKFLQEKEEQERYTDIEYTR